MTSETRDEKLANGDHVEGSARVGHHGGSYQSRTSNKRKRERGLRLKEADLVAWAP